MTTLLDSTALSARLKAAETEMAALRILVGARQQLDALYGGGGPTGLPTGAPAGPPAASTPTPGNSPRGRSPAPRDAESSSRRARSPSPIPRRTAAKGARFACPVCHKVCANDFGVTVHMGMAHEGKYKRKAPAPVPKPATRQARSRPVVPAASRVTCPVCHKVCADARGMLIHRTMMHGKPKQTLPTKDKRDTSPADKVFRCPQSQCTRVFATQTHALNHYKTVHYLAPPEEMLDAEEVSFSSTEA
jgi:hypothetical protein